MDTTTNIKDGDIKKQIHGYLDTVRVQETSCDTLRKTYDKMSDLYDVTRDIREYTGPDVLAQTLDDLFGEGQDMCILDVGAGTGHAGEQLFKRGFQNIHALDASQKMLDIAARKNIYQKTICCMLSKDPTDICEDTYDVICSTGCFVPGHLPYDSILEMIRIVKSGGYICLFVRDDILDSCDYYKDKFYPLVDSLEVEGKLELHSRSTWPNYIPGVGGLKLIYKVTK